MAKSFTPILSLALVVALAMAAVFGSMSLANPAQAQANDKTITDLKVDSVATTAVNLSWTVEGYADVADDAGTHYQVRVEETGDSTTRTGWVTGNSAPFEVTVEDTDHTVTAAITSAGAIALIDNTTYTFYVRNIEGGAGAAESVDATPNVVPDTGVITISAASVDDDKPGEVMLTWSPANDADANITNWQYKADVGTVTADTSADPITYSWAAVADEAGDWTDFPGEVTGEADGDFMGSITGLENKAYRFMVRASNGMALSVESGQFPTGSREVNAPGTAVAYMPAAVPPPPPEPVDPTFSAGSTSSFSNTSYKVEFQTGDAPINTLRDELVIEFHEDYTLPSSISNAAVTIVVDGAVASEEDAKTILTFNPSDIVVDGEEAVFSLGDMNEDDDLSQYDINPEAVITVNFRQSAGIRNPTEAGDYNIVKIAFGDDFEIDNEDEKITGLNIEDAVRRKISLSEEDGGLGDTVRATAKAFENGVTLHFFLDKQDSKGEINGILDSDEDILCSVSEVSGSNVGSCEFEVTTPTFSTGYNFINAVDGDGNIAYDPDNDDHRFELTASISASPAGGSPGEIMQVQLVSFPSGAMINRVRLSGDNICGGTTAPPGGNSVVPCLHGNVNSEGSASIAVTVPNWAVAGVQELRVYAGGENDPTNVTIVGPRIISTPSTVVANQRVSLVGTGFSPNSVLGNDTQDGRDHSKISIGGHPISWSKVNDGRDVNVDDGGNWAASVDLPLVEATTGSGERTIRITDSMGRTGSLNVSLAERSFDITPPQGRVGTLAVVRGMGYPSKNDEGHSFTIDVIYKVQEGATARVSVVPDASGRFEVQLRIPTTASIPSTNQVEVSFDHEAGGTSVLENKQHFVPEGIIELSETSGGPGTTITLSGEGFKTYVPVESVKIGTIEITPSPKPNTDANGMLNFDVLIPGLDVGIQTVEVKVGGTTSSTGFTVTESAVAPGDIQEVAAAIEELGDNLVSVWHFNNDTKVWAFYDPNLAEGNTLTHMITGETYLIRVQSTAEVILNRDTRSLTCVGANCWNQIVW